MSYSFHLAGIIPVSGQPLDFDFPWHDSLMPLSKDYLAIEHSVVECAYAGCDTIWVICNDDIQPLVRHRLGDYVQDPVWIHRLFDPSLGDSQRPIPIYYVPIHPRDRNKRDCLGWSALYGTYTAWKISRGMSKWLQPNKYYVSFPYGVYRLPFLRAHRKIISSKKNFLLSTENGTIKDGIPAGFTYSFEENKKLSAELWKASRSYSTEDVTSFTLKEVFGTLDTEESNVVKLENFWQVDSWQDYCDNICEISQNIKRPSKKLLKYHEWGGIGNE